MSKQRFNPKAKALMKHAEERGFVFVRANKHIVMAREGRNVVIQKSPGTMGAAMATMKDIERIAREIEHERMDRK